MIDYLSKWGVAHKLDTRVDETGNVIIRKPATKGYENRKTVILQSHMDMVCDKLVDVEFDFDKDAIQTEIIDGKWLKAKGTTLGADDGIGCAMELALLESDDICHGPIECVFTRDEETQLVGASNMKADFMTGSYLINLDSEDEGEIFVSCAGGRTTRGEFEYTREEAPKEYFFLEGSIKGLNGGHSGDDIDKKRANAIKILARFLYMESKDYDIRLAQFNSGKLHNAIPRDGKFVIAVPYADKEFIVSDWNVFNSFVRDEFHVADTTMIFDMSSTNAQSVLPKETSERIINVLQAIDNGVYAISQDKELNGLVETSSNIAVVNTATDRAVILASQRSSVMSNLDNMCNTIEAVLKLGGAKVVQNDGYPAWAMKKNSELQSIAISTYKQLYGKEPIVRGIHAGLECGLFSERYPKLDMISMGPTLRDVHTPEERLLISTVKMVWDHLLEILKNIPTE